MQPIIMLRSFFQHTATTKNYTLSLHDALPISPRRRTASAISFWRRFRSTRNARRSPRSVVLRRYWITGSRRAFSCCRLGGRSEEHTSELQSRLHLVCRLLLEKKKRGGRARGRV